MIVIKNTIMILLIMVCEIELILLVSNYKLK
jgi:hypothetical protein